MRIRKIQLLLMMPVVLAILVSCGGQPIKTFQIKKGPFRQTIVESGELAAIDTRSFVLPSYGRYWYQMKIIGLLDHGTEVKAGDSIIQLDPVDVKKYIINVETDLAAQKASLQKLIVNQDTKLNQMESNLKSEQASFDLRKLEMESSRFESERIRKIKELEFRQAKITLSKAEKNFKFNKIIASNELKIQKIRVKQAEKEVRSAYAVLPKLTIRTPISGIFQVAKSRNSNNMIKIGDQIFQGNNMGNVPNLTWMKVNTTVNENDFYKLSIGQKVEVRLDAVAKLKFKGEVISIGKLCHLKEAKSRQRVFDVEVKLLVSDHRLKPGMTVSCEFYCKELPNVTYIPLNCVENTESGNFIYLKKEGDFLRTEVETGPANNTHIVIRGGYKEGQEVAPVNQFVQKEKK
ncbi:MAG: efflux RND transporter periplasmic adaptor subunit [Bacteroidales bacterium]|nr:efflux RND transporter periplasmic adaptor subunit [Bacteroidales bacterium]